MSAEWIEGRFEGIYSGSLREARSGGGRLIRGRLRGKSQVSSSDSRRFPFRIDSGRLTDSSDCDAPSEHDDPRNIIRQDRVAEIHVTESATETASTERQLALFDVEIRDWELKHPAEAGGRAFGTIVGTLRARRRPAAPRPVVPDAAPRERKKNLGPAPIEAPPEDAPRWTDTPDSSSPAEAAARMGWAMLFFGLALVGAAFWAGCGAQGAAFWLAPIATALILRRLTGRAFTTHAPWWTLPLLIGFQISVLGLPSIMGAAGPTSVCAIASDPLRMGLVAAPIIIAGALGLRGSMWLSGIIWTAMMCAGCLAAGAGGECSPTTSAAIQEKSAASLGKTETRSRTDASGRWPVMPPVLGPNPGAGSSLNPSTPSSSGTDSNLRLPDGGGSIDGLASLTEAGEKSGLALDRNSSPASVGSTLQREDAAFEAAADFRPRAETTETTSQAGLTAVQGGWVSPDHRLTKRELVLISIEQANRTPALFFKSGGAHRVYVPTDPIFESASAALRPKAQLVLSRVAALLAAAPRQRVVLDVHTDSAGSSEAQLGLSGDRARVVRAWLLDRGHIAATRFQMDAFGGGRPLVPPDGNHGAQEPNRRIEIRLVPAESS